MPAKIRKYLPFETVDAEAKPEPMQGDWPRWYRITLQPGDTAWNPASTYKALSFDKPTTIVYCQFRDGGWDVGVEESQ